MRRQSRVSASCVPLVASRNYQTKIAFLVGRPTSQICHATRFSAGFTVVRRGMHKTQVWCEHMCLRWSERQRCRLIASVLWEGTTLSDLVNPMSETFTLLRYPARGSLQGEIQLCQK